MLGAVVKSTFEELLDEAVRLYLNGSTVEHARGVKTPPFTTYKFYKELELRGITPRGRVSKRSEVSEDTLLSCKNCDQTKTAKSFSKSPETLTGYDTSRCLLCKKSKIDWGAIPIENKIFNRTKARAKRKGIYFNIAIEDIVLPEKCPVFDKPFIYGDHLWTYSIDRIEPEKGYIKGNIAIISNKANMMKSTASKEEILKLYLWLDNLN